MNLVRQILAVFLSVFLSFSAFAADNKKDVKKKQQDYPYFKLGVRPINTSGLVDWDRECVVTTTVDSPPLRMFYKSSDGFVKLSAFGIIRAPEEIIVNSATGFALRPKICANGIANPTDWIPAGEKKCGEVEKATQPVDPSPASSAPQFGLGLNPEDLGPKKLKFEEQKTSAVNDDPKQSKKAEVGVGAGKGDKKSKTWLYVLLGAAAAGILVALAGGGGSSKDNGGPAPDPKN